LGWVGWMHTAWQEGNVTSTSKLSDGDMHVNLV